MFTEFSLYQLIKERQKEILDQIEMDRIYVSQTKHSSAPGDGNCSHQPLFKRNEAFFCKIKKFWNYPKLHKPQLGIKPGFIKTNK